MMKLFKFKISKSNFPPHIIIGAVIVLFPIFAIMTFQDINRQKQNSIRLLVEKGAALIRSFEAGTRTGMMGRYWNNMQLQRLLTETAQQSDIAYLMVSDKKGTVLAHNDPTAIGSKHGSDLNLEFIFNSKKVLWRTVNLTGDKQIFEVYREFSPSLAHMPPPHRREMICKWLDSCPAEGKNRPEFQYPLVIFIGLDMKTIEDARQADMRHTVMMSAIMLLIGFSGIIIIFIAQQYRSAKTSLSQIKAFSDTLVDNMPIGIIAVNDQKKIASFNHVAKSVLNLNPEDTYGKDIQLVIPEELCKQIEKLDKESAIVETEIELMPEIGKTIPLDVSATHLKDETGNFLGYVVLFKDLTEVKELKKTIARTHRLASIGRLAAGVAHEIRNPLSSIKGFATYFKERYVNVPEDQEIAGIMIKETDRLNRVVSQLLELAKPVSITKNSLHLSTLIEHVIRLIERRAYEQHVTIETNFSNHINEIQADRDRLSQLLLNLFINSLDAMKNGGVLTIETALKSEIKRFEIQISDTGNGIEEEHLAHIFDPYFTTKPAGTGLGLAIVHNIIEAHDGEIFVKSEAGKGTSMIIHLPYS